MTSNEQEVLATDGAHRAYDREPAEPPEHQRVRQPLQPLLHDSVVLVSAPSQGWSAIDGTMDGRDGIHGFYHSDVRVLSQFEVLVDGERAENISHSLEGASSATFVSLVRSLDDETADPRVRLNQSRTISDGALVEQLTLVNALAVPIEAELSIRAAADFGDMQSIKGGLYEPANDLALKRDADGALLSADGVSARIIAEGARVMIGEHVVSATWRVRVAAHSQQMVRWRIDAHDSEAVVSAAPRSTAWSDVAVRSGDSRLGEWVRRALDDLGGLRLVTTAQPNDVFLAAGAPWFFTLFGRDSIWAARMLLPLGTELAASTLRVLAALQGTRDDPASAEQPGKIMHELRRGVVDSPDGLFSLAPLYYGTVDATALWIDLLVDAWKWGMPEAEVEALLPNLEAALAWMRDYGDSDGDGFLEYVDTTGHGLANQGWKDSGDSIQWRDGRLAEGPIALCEVQAYAYQAAVGGAELLDRFGRPGGDAWRSWAANLKDRFRESFWIESAGGRYPAVALDVHKQRVDTVTSNMGHLLGTGILDAEESRLVAARIASPELDSGFGLRTMSSDSAGFWPLSYHGGSVWTHDTAIAITGLGRAGFGEAAAQLTEGLLRAAEGFGYRMPELHSGDSSARTSGPVPYPAACRPQAWSAAAAVAVLGTVLGLSADAPSARLGIRPLPGAAPLTVEGLRFAGHSFGVVVE